MSIYVSVVKTEMKSKEWILVNYNCTGYYRVNYNLENWQRLIKQLETDHHVNSVHLIICWGALLREYLHRIPFQPPPYAELYPVLHDYHE